jgi:catechol 2,3-dioxygenase-like lactoylglutathione lyase family enzyme
MIGTLRNVAFDAPDHRALARFYTDLLGGEELGDSDEWTVIRTADGWRVGFQPVTGHRASSWPSQELPQQLHIDFQVPDVAAAALRAESLGAARASGSDGGERDDGGPKLVVMTDPAGHPFCLCASEQDEPIRVFGACIDCPDPAALARFYAALVGMEIRYEGDDGAWLAGANPAANLTFQAVADYNPPRWPDPAYPQQMHLDVFVDDVDAADQQVIGLGASHLPGSGDNWRVYADPAGHPFCLVFEPAQA